MGNATSSKHDKSKRFFSVKWNPCESYGKHFILNAPQHGRYVYISVTESRMLGICPGRKEAEKLPWRNTNFLNDSLIQAFFAKLRGGNNCLCLVWASGRISFLNTNNFQFDHTLDLNFGMQTSLSPVNTVNIRRNKEATVKPNFSRVLDYSKKNFMNGRKPRVTAAAQLSDSCVLLGFFDGSIEAITLSTGKSEFSLMAFSERRGPRNHPDTEKDTGFRLNEILGSLMEKRENGVLPPVGNIWQISQLFIAVSYEGVAGILILEIADLITIQSQKIAKARMLKVVSSNNGKPSLSNLFFVDLYKNPGIFVAASTESLTVWGTTNYGVPSVGNCSNPEDPIRWLSLLDLAPHTLLSIGGCVDGKYDREMNVALLLYSGGFIAVIALLEDQQEGFTFSYNRLIKLPNLEPSVGSTSFSHLYYNEATNKLAALCSDSENDTLHMINDVFGRGEAIEQTFSLIAKEDEDNGHTINSFLANATAGIDEPDTFQPIIYVPSSYA